MLPTGYNEYTAVTQGHWQKGPRNSAGNGARETPAPYPGRPAGAEVPRRVLCACLPAAPRQQTISKGFRISYRICVPAVSQALGLFTEKPASCSGSRVSLIRDRAGEELRGRRDPERKRELGEE